MKPTGLLGSWNAESLTILDPAQIPEGTRKHQRPRPRFRGEIMLLYVYPLRISNLSIGVYHATDARWDANRWRIYLQLRVSCHVMLT